MSARAEEPRPATAAQLFTAQAVRLAAECDRQHRAMLDSDAPEATHRVRVTLRRLRSLVAGFAPILASGPRKRLEKRLRAAFRALGPLRDADVRARTLTEAPDAAAHRSAADALRREMRARLLAERRSGLAGELAALLTDPGLWRDSPHGQRLAAAPPEVLARRALEQAWGDLLAYGGDLATLDGETLHDFRKDLKTLRYLGEAVAPVWPGQRQRDFRTRLQKLQDALGTLNDLAMLHPDHMADHFTGRERKAMAKASKHWRKLRASGPWWREAAEGEVV